VQSDLQDTAMTALKTIYLKDYAPTPYIISHVELNVYLADESTLVRSVLSVAQRGNTQAELALHGEGLSLHAVEIDGVTLSPSQYDYTNDVLTISKVPAKPFELVVTQSCNPKANTALSGLYLSNNMFCTQMEAEGFRRFAFMYDRPDAMATYRVRLEAATSLPVLLSNGNLVETGAVGTDRHYAVWHDPHPKPTYLFALVAGDLASVQDTFTTSEGRAVSLGIYVEQGKEDRCAWAMEALKASMRWDEERFGLAYDLDVFNIVAVSDFNMGAMENKGLNIFNDKYILARPDTATDTDFVNIERIIAHEYFHNWTGNRITCRDWFQLCLKEGLTVFRDQEFTSDLRSRAVKRIEDVKTLRARQFPEDQGPLTHAVRPESYIEINNFYTPTVYEKGAELCRMLLTLVGREGFRAAMNLFFERHDGQAATVEDFLRCMADASGRDLSHFAKWYEQAGTPVVDVSTRYDEAAREFTVTLKQHTPATPGAENKVALHMPLRLGLLGSNGNDLPLDVDVLELKQPESTITFQDLPARPVLSINRGFSAPIILNTDSTDADLLFQVAHDTDSFNRWEAAQTSARRMMVKAYHGETVDSGGLAQALNAVLKSPELDNAFKALMLQLPGEAEITMALVQDVDATKLHGARRRLVKSIAGALQPLLKSAMDATQESEPYTPNAESTARRSLHLTALGLLALCDDGEALSSAECLFETIGNMTIKAGAIGAVLHCADERVDRLLQRFYDRHSNDHLIVDKWLMLSAARPAQHAAERIKTMMRHGAFTLKTPNKVYALLGGFTGSNLVGFHAADGSGYRLLADVIVALNGINPQVASRIATSFRSWKRYDAVRRDHAASEMTRILATESLSKDVFEIISRTLGKK
jgi:aminopeptidase N